MIALASDVGAASDTKAGAAEEAEGAEVEAAAAAASATTSGDERERECVACIEREAANGSGATAAAVLDDASGRVDAENEEDGDSGGFDNENTGARAESERRCRVFGTVAVCGAAAFGSEATSPSIVAAASAALVGDDAGDNDEAGDGEDTADDDDVSCSEGSPSLLSDDDDARPASEVETDSAAVVSIDNETDIGAAGGGGGGTVPTIDSDGKTDGADSFSN
jgi:hypothetical protein